jgi:hypothetical protein
MRRQEFRWLLSLFTAATVAAACAGEEHDSKFEAQGNNGGRGGSGGSTSKGGSSSTSKGGSGGSSSTSKGGSGEEAGASTGGSGGTGGSTAGTSAGGISGGGSGGQSNTGDCDVGGAGFGDDALRVELEASSVQSSEQPGGDFRIVNDSGSAIAESEFSLRYYFTSEFPCDDAAQTVVQVYDFRRQMPHDDSPGAGDVVKNVVVVGANGEGCDVYVEFVFTIDLATEQYATLNFGTFPPNNDYNSHTSDQSNDASFGACTTMSVPWTSTPLFVDDVLTWGEEPETGAGGGGNAGGAGGAGGASDAAGAGGAAPGGGVGGA